MVTAELERFRGAVERVLRSLQVATTANDAKYSDFDLLPAAVRSLSALLRAEGETEFNRYHLHLFLFLNWEMYRRDVYLPGDTSGEQANTTAAALYMFAPSRLWLSTDKFRTLVIKLKLGRHFTETVAELAAHTCKALTAACDLAIESLDSDGISGHMAGSNLKVAAAVLPVEELVVQKLNSALRRDAAFVSGSDKRSRDVYVSMQTSKSHVVRVEGRKKVLLLGMLLAKESTADAWCRCLVQIAKRVGPAGASVPRSVYAVDHPMLCSVREWFATAVSGNEDALELCAEIIVENGLVGDLLAVLTRTHRAGNAPVSRDANFWSEWVVWHDVALSAVGSSQADEQVVFRRYCFEHRCEASGPLGDVLGLPVVLQEIINARLREGGASGGRGTGGVVSSFHGSSRAHVTTVLNRLVEGSLDDEHFMQTARIAVLRAPVLFLTQAVTDCLLNKGQSALLIQLIAAIDEPLHAIGLCTYHLTPDCPQLLASTVLDVLKDPTRPLGAARTRNLTDFFSALFPLPLSGANSEDKKLLHDHPNLIDPSHFLRACLLPLLFAEGTRLDALQCVLLMFDHMLAYASSSSSPSLDMTLGESIPGLLSLVPRLRAWPGAEESLGTCMQCVHRLLTAAPAAALEWESGASLVGWEVQALVASRTNTSLPSIPSLPAALVAAINRALHGHNSDASTSATPVLVGPEMGSFVTMVQQLCDVLRLARIGDSVAAAVASVGKQHLPVLFSDASLPHPALVMALATVLPECCWEEFDRVCRLVLPALLGDGAQAFLVATLAQTCHVFLFYCCPEAGGGSEDSSLPRSPLPPLRTSRRRRFPAFCKHLLQCWLAILKDSEPSNADAGADSEGPHVLATLFSALCEFASLTDDKRLGDDMQHLMRPFGVLASSVLNQLLLVGAKDAARLRDDCSLLPNDIRVPMLARVKSPIAFASAEPGAASA